MRTERWETLQGTLRLPDKPYCGANGAMRFIHVPQGVRNRFHVRRIIFPIKQSPVAIQFLIIFMNVFFVSVF
jgi:hypothetical protein